MIDGIKITKPLNGRTIKGSSLVQLSSGHDWKQYKIKGTPLNKYNGSTPTVTVSQDKLTITGSLPYLLKDNSLTPFSYGDVQLAIDYLSNIVGINLYDATVLQFEFGLAVEIPFSFSQFIYHHLGHPEMTTADYGKKGKYFQNKDKCIKLYDAKLNAKFKLSDQVKTQLISTSQLKENSDYAKVEIKYKNPAKYFGQPVLFSDLFDPDFLSVCNHELIITYQDIRKIGFKTPTDKKQLESIHILAILLKEMEQQTGIDVEERLYKKLKSLRILTTGQRHDRKNTIRAAFETIKPSGPNPFDITDILIQELVQFLEAA